MAEDSAATDPEEERFYGDLERGHLAPLWKILGQLAPRTPSPRARAHLWRWKDVLPLIEESGSRFALSGGERRVLGVINPGFENKWAATETLWAAYQYILPGENAPAHRHSAAAIRFIIEGEGAYTTVEGDRCILDRGDFVFTPPWTWHDHGNDSERPVIWMDGLDIPLVAEMDASFFEPIGDHPAPAPKPKEDSESRYGSGALLPAWREPAGAVSPLLLYKWAQTEEALRRLARVDASPFDDVAMEYVNPTTGGPVLPTMACWIQLIRPGVRTRAHRHTSSAVYLAAEGRGESVIGGVRFAWERGDMFAVPSWLWHEHAAAEGEEGILFSIHDTPVMKSLGLYIEEALGEGNGHQEAPSVFGG
ncbi:MAG: cupin domain-containing protein [bacterium]